MDADLMTVATWALTVLVPSLIAIWQALKKGRARAALDVVVDVVEKMPEEEIKDLLKKRVRMISVERGETVADEVTTAVRRIGG
jgi:hypothetical protein